MSARYTGGLVYNAPGGWSGFFPSNSSLTFGYTSGIALGSTYTMECWINPTSVSQGYLFEMAQSNTGGFSYLVFYISSGQVGSAVRPSTSGTEYYNAAGTVVAGVWQHVALVNTAGTAQLYVNGIAVGSTYSMPALSTTPVFCAIGQRANGFSPSGTYYNGYISNLRITTSAVYTGNFTPPVGQLSAIANTKLLTCAYPTFVDGSTNAYALTATSTTVSTVNPFPTSQLPNPALGGAGNGVYTMSQYAALKAANLWPAFDPFYKNVTLNLHGNGTNAAQNNTFLDSSTNNFTITRNGNTTQGTWSPYTANGYWSNYFNGSSGYASLPYNANYVLGTNDFTVESWVLFNDISTNAKGLYSLGYGANGSGPVTCTWQLRYLGSEGSNQLQLERYDGSTETQLTTSGFSPVNGTWYHIAISRTGGYLRIFVNGVALYSAANTFNYSAINTSDPFLIGLSYNGPQSGYNGPRYFNGYISNLRVINGTGIYSSNFTPPTEPLTAVTNTKLLTCQSNRYVDNSSIGATLSPSGTTSVQRYVPFVPTTAYSTSVVGGSSYFDGSGDSMTVGTSANCASGGACAMGANFTFEFWYYPLSTAEQTLIENFTGTGGPGWTMYRKSGGQIEVYNGTSAFSGSVVLTTGQWYHIAFVRTSSTSAKTYINGVADMSTTSFGSGEYFQSTYPLYVGQRNPGDGRNFYTTGYFSDVRVTKSAVYSANFTPPTAPIAPIANTSAMLSYTNAAIIDNAMMTDWETLGSAQLNTTYKKYGSGSISMLATGDYCRSTQPSTVGDINGGDFTIEFWVYFTSVAANRGLISKYGNTAENAGGLGYVLQFQQSVPSLRFVLGVGGGTDAVYDFAWSPAISTWYHVAVTRSGSSARAFVNGSQIGSTTTVSTSDVASPNGTQIGKTHTVGQYLLGYMDDIRVTKGVARYTANFTPPTSQVQDQ